MIGLFRWEGDSGGGLYGEEGVLYIGRFFGRVGYVGERVVVLIRGSGLGKGLGKGRGGWRFGGLCIVLYRYKDWVFKKKKYYI